MNKPGKSLQATSLITTLSMFLAFAVSPNSPEFSKGLKAEAAAPLVCNVYALMPEKRVSEEIKSVAARGSIRCINGVPNSCTAHIYLENYDSYYKSWVRISGLDRWQYKCPTKSNLTKDFYSGGFECRNPEIKQRWRSVVYATLEFYGQKRNFHITSNETTLSC
jgi:hypothetical protein